MSYDVYFTIDAGGPEPATVGDHAGLNYTYNCAAMFRAAIGGNGLRDLNGMLASDAIPRLEAAIASMKNPANEEMYASLNPKNGWGSHSGATKFLEEVLEQAREYPKATLCV